MEGSKNAERGQDTTVAEKQELRSIQSSTPNFHEAVQDQPSDEEKKPPVKADSTSQVEDLDPAAERLARDPTPLTVEEFYSLLGVSMPTSSSDGLKQLANPHGLYSQIYKQMQYTNRKFKAFDLATYILLLIQVILSAVFIILGSLRNVDTHITIAVLGALATIISGGLALMKGQGLPNRLRQTRDSLRDVIFEIDEMYWDVQTGRQVLFKDIKKIREKYLTALAQERQNHPDVWNDAVAAIGANAAMAKKSGRNL